MRQSSSTLAGNCTTSFGPLDLSRFRAPWKAAARLSERGPQTDSALAAKSARTDSGVALARTI